MDLGVAEADGVVDARAPRQRLRTHPYGCRVCADFDLINLLCRDSGKETWALPKPTISTETPPPRLGEFQLGLTATPTERR